MNMKIYLDTTTVWYYFLLPNLQLTNHKDTTLLSKLSKYQKLKYICIYTLMSIFIFFAVSFLILSMSSLVLVVRSGCISRSRADVYTGDIWRRTTDHVGFWNIDVRFPFYPGLNYLDTYISLKAQWLVGIDMVANEWSKTSSKERVESSRKTYNWVIRRIHENIIYRRI